jgi:hypothetical protein
MKMFLLDLVSFFAGATISLGATIQVTNHDDSGPGSLRDAIAGAASGDTIAFTLPTPDTITLTSGELLVRKNLTIAGPGEDSLTITRSSASNTPHFPVFHVPTGNFAVYLSGLTLTNGNNDGVTASGRGGGLNNESSRTVTVSACRFIGNQAYYSGGGIYNEGPGTLTITDCTITANSTISGDGGGLYGDSTLGGGTVSVLRCDISANTANYNGGGIANYGTMMITESTASDNLALESGGSGGGVSTSGTMVIERCTISDNTSMQGGGGGIASGGAYPLTLDSDTVVGNWAFSDGGGISNDGVTVITNCTISGNTAVQTFPGPLVTGGGGIINVADAFATVTLRNTIVAQNVSPTNPDVAGLAGAIRSLGFNLIGDRTGADIAPDTGDQIGTSSYPINPLLGPLANNGGLTKTSALLPGSPAIDAGSQTAPPQDQRNYDRQDGSPDIGAYELGATIPKTLANISTRLKVGLGENVLIGGFIIAGTHNKKVLLRAIGPSLNLDGKLGNPFLELHNSTGDIVAGNDDWQSNANQQEIINTGIAPDNPLESALLMNLRPGAYTAIVRGANGGTGIALVEIYDLARTSDSRLANISTRGFVQGGNNVMIGGFIVSGSEKEEVLVRAVGPSLALPGKLVDPILELHNQDGAIVALNDNWGDTQESAIEATGIAPTDDAESAILSTLAPGNYTAIVRGVGGTTGIALVEVYGFN